MISTFSFPTTIHFGRGVVKQLPQWLNGLRVQRPLVVTDPGLVATAAFKEVEHLSAGGWPVFSGVHPNPIAEDVDLAAAAFTQHRCDAVIGFGGGSALDVGKAVRLRVKRPDKPLADFDFNDDWSGLAPFIAIPTTAGTGSEVGRSSVVIIGGRKKVLFHPSLLAATVVLDPELTRTLPPKLTAATGADALTHCIESYTSPVLHPLCDGIALEGLCLIASSLSRVVNDGNDLEARGKMQLAAMMGGIAFQKDLGATHSLAHPLSMICGMHHGTANALCLPHVMEFNAARKPGLYYRVGVAMGLNNPDDHATIDFVRSLLREIGLGGTLRVHGVNPSHLDALTEQAFEDSCHKTNPVPVTREELRGLFEKALGE
jgi:4-hydroxybutyrate dehydrogenase